MRQLNRVAQQVEKTFGNINKLKINIKNRSSTGSIKKIKRTD